MNTWSTTRRNELLQYLRPGSENGDPVSFHTGLTQTAGRIAERRRFLHDFNTRSISLLAELERRRLNLSGEFQRLVDRTNNVKELEQYVREATQLDQEFSRVLRHRYRRQQDQNANRQLIQKAQRHFRNQDILQGKRRVLQQMKQEHQQIIEILSGVVREMNLENEFTALSASTGNDVGKLEQYVRQASQINDEFYRTVRQRFASDQQEPIQHNFRLTNTLQARRKFLRNLKRTQQAQQSKQRGQQVSTEGVAQTKQSSH